MPDATIRFDLLRKLHTFIMGLPVASFHLDTIIEEEGDLDAAMAGQVNECGTIGCALGWAALMPEFRALGLTWDSESLDLNMHGQYTNFISAGQQLFGITDNDSSNLFSPVGDSDYDDHLEDEYGNFVFPDDHRQVFDYRLRQLFGAHQQSL